eukprot:CAMPEP_0115533924 /NCGR_PEP_ID=MMETSP0271-20121206/86389_1 /TAXON_ID=71861 /ORGANISM="Scrippsiella trochoidea, Strain CCMP3099" /LENGTH=84 /DNA_ID=CAMNT_0002966355 /DNA_START=412 /DNA_END=665 /DNA_ORIENTATION=-
MGSSLSLRSFSRVCSSLAVLGFQHIGSSFSLRSFVRYGSALGISGVCVMGGGVLRDGQDDVDGLVLLLAERLAISLFNVSDAVH